MKHEVQCTIRVFCIVMTTGPSPGFLSPYAMHIKPHPRFPAKV